MLEKLITAGADIHQPDGSGTLPVSIAAELGNIEALELLAAKAEKEFGALVLQDLFFGELNRLMPFSYSVANVLEDVEQRAKEDDEQRAKMSAKAEKKKDKRASASARLLLRDQGLNLSRGPSVSLFRGEKPDEKSWMSAGRRVFYFKNTLLTMRSRHRCPPGSKAYFEITIMWTRERSFDIRAGVASAAFKCIRGDSWGSATFLEMDPRRWTLRKLRAFVRETRSLGDDEHSWAVQNTKKQFYFAAGKFATLHSILRCPQKGKVFYELEILERGEYQECGGFLWTPPRSRRLRNTASFAAAAFERVLEASEEEDEAVGDDSDPGLCWGIRGGSSSVFSHLVDTMHKGGKGKYACEWTSGDVIGLACDLDKMQIHVSVNGSFAPPKGVVVALAPDAVRDGLYAA